MTVTSLLNELIILFARVSGGRIGNTLNTPSQYGNIVQVLTHIEMNKWVQEVFVQISQIIDRPSQMLL